MTNSNYASEMRFISHRGNINGPNREKENSPEYILQAVEDGFDVEIDLWYLDNKYYLGHDAPEHEIEEDFLINPKFWVHCKTVETLARLVDINYQYNFFFHHSDKAVLTSGKFLWVYPGVEVFGDCSITVMPEQAHKGFNWRRAAGVCSDHIVDYKKAYETSHETDLEKLIKEQ